MSIAGVTLLEQATLLHRRHTTNPHMILAILPLVSAPVQVVIDSPPISPPSIRLLGLEPIPGQQVFLILLALLRYLPKIGDLDLRLVIHLITRLLTCPQIKWDPLSMLPLVVAMILVMMKQQSPRIGKVVQMNNKPHHHDPDRRFNVPTMTMLNDRKPWQLPDRVNPLLLPRSQLPSFPAPPVLLDPMHLVGLLVPNSSTTKKTTFLQPTMLVGGNFPSLDLVPVLTPRALPY
jgi:hypothetical protein